MHVWHHDMEWPTDRPSGVNFGIVLSAWDWLFGTAHWPSGDASPEQQPRGIGFRGIGAFPRGVVRRFLYPLSRLW
jgi:sterol desaturase/sphingolipid hydroxylase (fatty acid hydroxylase superfamily)